MISEKMYKKIKVD